MSEPVKKPKPEDQWRPHTTPGFEVNGKGQLRTQNHQPGNVPTPPKRPAVIEDDGADEWDSWGCFSRMHG